MASEINKSFLSEKKTFEIHIKVDIKVLDFKMFRREVNEISKV